MKNFKTREKGLFPRKTKKLNPKKVVTPPDLSMIDSDVAGIDVGSESHYVAVPADRAEMPVRQFRSFTQNLYEMADWLAECKIKKVYMESTGVYWIALYDILEMRGFEVFLVNARHVKNVTGRKSDVMDCQWLQQLGSFGLLRGAFRPPREIVALRSVVRTRENLVRDQGHQIQLVQKSYTQMNMQIHNVLSDMAGVSGMAITRAIVAGERDLPTLAGLCDRRVKATQSEVMASLEGDWLPEHLLGLECAVTMYDAYDRQIALCDKKIETMLADLARHEVPEEKKTPRVRHSRNTPDFDLQTVLRKMAGVDLTTIDGIGLNTALVILSEVGPDLSKFPSEKHFSAWAGVAPGTRITGGKIISGKVLPSHNRVGQALRLAAVSLGRSGSALGAYYRRMCARLGKKSAIVATAHKLARIVYTLLTKGEEYVDAGQKAYEEIQKNRSIRSLERRARELGFELTPVPAV